MACSKLCVVFVLGEHLWNSRIAKKLELNPAYVILPISQYHLFLAGAFHDVMNQRPWCPITRLQ